MATAIWQGSDGDWANTSNWSTTPALPGTSDDILFDGTSTGDVTTNVDRTADGTWGSDRRITVTKEYTGKIGGTGDPLDINFQGTIAMYGSGDEFWFNNTNATAVAHFIAAPMQSGANACQIDGKVADLTVHRGKVQLDASATIEDEVRVFADPEAGGSPILVVPNGVTVTGSTVHVLDGELQSDVAWPLLVQDGGTTKLSHSTAATITEMHQGGGTCIPKLATIATHYGYGNARFDGASYARWTVTTMHAMKGAFVDLRNGGGIEPGTLFEYPGADVKHGSGAST
jgi:hypothetical protein